MDVINPLANALAQSVAVARQQSAGKVQQIRRVQALQKDVAAEGDRFEHQVESTDDLSPAHDDAGRRGDDAHRKKRKTPTPTPDRPPSIDVTA